MKNTTKNLASEFMLPNCFSRGCQLFFYIFPMYLIFQTLLPYSCVCNIWCNAISGQESISAPIFHLNVMQLNIVESNGEKEIEENGKSYIICEELLLGRFLKLCYSNTVKEFVP